MTVSKTEETSPKKQREVNTTLISKNVTVNGHRTSMRLEPEMWGALQEISKREKCTIHRICSIVAKRKSEKSSLTAAIRVFVMAYYRAASTEEGHARAGHGYRIKHNLIMGEERQETLN